MFIIAKVTTLLAQIVVPKSKPFPATVLRLQLVHIAFQGYCNVAALPSTPELRFPETEAMRSIQRHLASLGLALWNPPAPLLQAQFTFETMSLCDFHLGSIANSHHMSNKREKSMSRRITNTRNFQECQSAIIP